MLQTFPSGYIKLDLFRHKGITTYKTRETAEFTAVPWIFHA